MQPETATLGGVLTDDEIRSTRALASEANKLVKESPMVDDDAMYLMAVTEAMFVLAEDYLQHRAALAGLEWREEVDVNGEYTTTRWRDGYQMKHEIDRILAPLKEHTDKP